MKLKLSNNVVGHSEDLLNADTNRILTVELPTQRFAMFQEGHGFIGQDQDGFYNEGMTDVPTMQYLTRQDAMNARTMLIDQHCGF